MTDEICILYKGDDVVDVGTIREIAKRRGVKESTVYYYSMPAYRRRGKGGNRLMLVRAGDEP